MKHYRDKEEHPTFKEHTWKDWPNASDLEKAEMKKKLENTFGYL